MQRRAKANHHTEPGILQQNPIQLLTTSKSSKILLFLRFQAFGLALHSAFISPCTPYSVRSGRSPDAPVLRIHQAGRSPDAEEEEEEEEEEEDDECGVHNFRLPASGF
jgi:hypothetical protein